MSLSNFTRHIRNLREKLRRSPAEVPGPSQRAHGPWPIPENLDFIKQHEGLRLRAYMPTPNDVPTIGYGHTRNVQMGDIITRAQAHDLLRQDVAWVKGVIDRTVAVPLHDNEVAALFSFVFNVGGTAFRTSTMLRKLNQGDYAGAAQEFPRWNKQAGIALRGLTNRRKAEQKLFRSYP